MKVITMGIIMKGTIGSITKNITMNIMKIILIIAIDNGES